MGNVQERELALHSVIPACSGLLLSKAPVFVFSLFLTDVGRWFELKKTHPEGALETNSSNSLFICVLELC